MVTATKENYTFRITIAFDRIVVVSHFVYFIWSRSTSSQDSRNDRWWVIFVAKRMYWTFPQHSVIAQILIKSFIFNDQHNYHSLSGIQNACRRLELRKIEKIHLNINGTWSNCNLEYVGWMVSFSILSGENEPQLFDAMEIYSYSYAISNNSDCKLYKAANWNLNKNICTKLHLGRFSRVTFLFYSLFFVFEIVRRHVESAYSVLERIVVLTSEITSVVALDTLRV